MRKTLITILLLMFTKLVFAEKCYVFIDKNGENVQKGNAVKGEVIRIVPVSDMPIEPHGNELVHHKVIVMDLTEQEKLYLMEKDEITNERKNKIDINTVKDFKDNVEVKQSEKTSIIDSVSVKSISSEPVE